MAYDSIYVYGIVKGIVKKTFEKQGIGDREDDVYCIPYKDVTAIVSDTPFMEYDPTEENTLAHENVIQTLLKENLTVAPMRFCTILASKNDILRLLHSGYMAFKKNILKIQDKKEYGVKVFLDIDRLQKKVRDDEKILSQSRNIATTLHEKLKQIAEETSLDEQITGDMIMNASFLLHNKKVKEFYEEIKEFDSTYTDVVTIRISGPTAPYNFVSMPTR